MAESRGSLLAKSVQKHAGRAKEKILQNLGKVDRTADEIFDEHLQNFTRQQNAANKLHKEFSNYIRCIRACQAASKTLLEAIGEIYEPQWTGHDLLYVQTQSVDAMWQEFSHKLADQVLLPLNTYQCQFPEMRKKIDKRNRKLIDYDSQRHSFQALQANSSKRRDEVKLQRGREQLDEAKRTYEMLNSELHDELPALYDSRVLFLVTNLQSLFNAEGTFHTEASKVYNELESIVDKLATDSQRGSYTIKKTNGTTGSLPRSTISTLKNSSELIMNNTLDTLNSSKTPSNDAPSPLPTAAVDSPTNAAHSPPDSPTPVVEMNGNGTISAIDSPDSPEPRPPLAERHVNPAPSDKGDAPAAAANAIGHAQEHKKVEELYYIPPGATTDNLPPGVLYRVKATYKYNREDVDELSFEVGEVINVVEYDDPEEQEEGWLMGIKETTGEKGMFPANFTRPL